MRDQRRTRDEEGIPRTYLVVVKSFLDWQCHSSSRSAVVVPSRNCEGRPCGDVEGSISDEEMTRNEELTRNEKPTRNERKRATMTVPPPL
jgi:hypothetical protein